MDARLTPVEIKHIEDKAIKTWRKDKIHYMVKVIGAIATIVTLITLLKPLLIKFLIP
jgi:hypothetical protein